MDAKDGWTDGYECSKLLFLIISEPALQTVITDSRIVHNGVSSLILHKYESLEPRCWKSAVGTIGYQIQS